MPLALPQARLRHHLELLLAARDRTPLPQPQGNRQTPSRPPVACPQSPNAPPRDRGLDTPPSRSAQSPPCSRSSPPEPRDRRLKTSPQHQAAATRRLAKLRSETSNQRHSARTTRNPRSILRTDGIAQDDPTLRLRPKHEMSSTLLNQKPLQFNHSQPLLSIGFRPRYLREPSPQAPDPTASAPPGS